MAFIVDGVTLSVVVPAFNEELTLEAFYEALVPHLESLKCSWEIVFVNDGSRDGTAAILRSLHQRDSRVKALHFSRNFGHQIALTAGMAHACGDAVVMMDADLQHPPAVIPEMVRLWRDEKFNIVYTIRTYGEEIGLVKKVTSQLFYQCINALSEVEFIPGVADFRLMDRKSIDAINAMPEESRFVRGMVRWLGFRQTGIPYIAAPRIAGESKYNLRKMLSFAISGITSFSTKPLRWISYSGIAVACLGLFYAAYVLFETLFLGGTVPGWPTLVITLLILGGWQLISLGVIGEYVGKIYMETKRRPLYVVQERLGFDTEDNAEILHRVASNESKAA